MLTTITLAQGLVFLIFFLLERIHRALPYPVPLLWDRYWLGLQVYAAGWLALFAWVWLALPTDWNLLAEFGPFTQAALFYLVYSLGTYWLHRIKHSIPVLWRYVHYLHHAPAHMEARIAYWRHPTEIAFNSLYLLILGKAMGVSFITLLGALSVEAILEMIHHANVRTPRMLRGLGFLIQLPEMHLIHHQRNLHRWNYSPVALWDLLFGTRRVPEGWEWKEKLGVSLWRDLERLMFLKY